MFDFLIGYVAGTLTGAAVWALLKKGWAAYQAYKAAKGA